MKKTVVTIGGGHAGVEAACAAASIGCRSLLITPDRRRIALMPCNPSIGGIAKGTLVRELDSMGGVSPVSADRTALQFRMLNRKKGPAVWGPRTQNDISLYCREQTERLAEAGVTIIEDIVTSIDGPSQWITAAVTQGGKRVQGDCFVLAAGTFLGGMLHRGSRSWPGGRRGDISSIGLEKELRRRMFHVKRFKTGTSPRVLRSSVDTGSMQLQDADRKGYRFSWRTNSPVKGKENCWLSRTTEETEGIIRESLKHSPLYSGRITGKGPRYCPSFEDKVTKFPERTGHPIHLEPTGADSRIMYINGFSTSLPEEIQERALRSIPGFKEVTIAAFGYSVEYSCFEKGEYDRTLRLRGTGNMFAAGQVLGTSGYEEAAATGLLAGANAARRALGLPEGIPNRLESYLGVLVDDLVTRGADEPYRLFSSRAENRLHLRQDNADRRLWGFGMELGTISPAQTEHYTRKLETMEEIRRVMSSKRIEGASLEDLARRPETTPETVAGILGVENGEVMDIVETIVLDIKYGGYIERARRRHQARNRFRDVDVSWIGDFGVIESMSIEAAQALNASRPNTVGEAERMSGVRQSDLDALVLHVMKRSVSRET